MTRIDLALEGMKNIYEENFNDKHAIAKLKKELRKDLQYLYYSYLWNVDVSRLPTKTKFLLKEIVRYADKDSYEKFIKDIKES